MKELLVASVFAGHEADRFWLALQLRQLRRTTVDFDHAVYLNGADRSLFAQSQIIGSCRSPRQFSEGHHDALQEVSAFCRTHAYRNYLIIDSDAFPVRSGWLEVLKGALERAGKGFAAPIRTENLDRFPHPSIFFTSDPEAATFELRPTRPLLGRDVVDLHAGPDTESWFPLLRTNRITRHPVLAGIYFDLFYHHGCGSREFRMRATNSGYYDHMLGRFSSPEALFEELTRDSEAYLRDLL